jgi:hypothetical protein
MTIAKWFLLAFAVFSCTTNENALAQGTQSKVPAADYSSMVVLPFDTNYYWIFEGKCKNAALSTVEIDMVDALVKDCIAQYMKDRKRDDQYAVARKGYNLQLVAVTNEHGEKEVWVNAICKRSTDNWRSGIVMVMDGGNCYYHMKVNLSKKTYYDFGVNGYA